MLNYFKNKSRLKRLNKLAKQLRLEADTIISETTVLQTDGIQSGYDDALFSNRLINAVSIISLWADGSKPFTCEEVNTHVLDTLRLLNKANIQTNAIRRARILLRDIWDNPIC